MIPRLQIVDEIKKMLTPSKVDMTKDEFVHHVGNKTSYVQRELVKVAEVFNREKYKTDTGGLPKGACKNSIAFLAKTLATYVLANVKEGSNGPYSRCNSPYLLPHPDGRDFILEDWVDGSDKVDEKCPTRLVKLVAVFSTEEFVLNAYRAFKQGFDIHLLVDATYRLTTDRNLGYIVVSVPSITQTGRLVAIALTNTELTEAHGFIFSAIKKSVEDIVTQRVRDGFKFC